MEPSSRNSLPVIIIGGGFAGVTLAQHLEKQLDSAIELRRRDILAVWRRLRQGEQFGLSAVERHEAKSIRRYYK